MNNCFLWVSFISFGGEEVVVDYISFFGGYYYVVVALGIDPRKAVEQDEDRDVPMWVKNMLCAAT